MIGSFRDFIFLCCVVAGVDHVAEVYMVYMIILYFIFKEWMVNKNV